jgi:Zn-finger nucleic acid-binding protein
MSEVSVAEYTVDRCTSCSGLWFDLREHEHIAKSPARVQALDTGDAAQGAQQNAKRDVPCPLCHVKMLKLSVPAQPHIQYESCPVCYGAFFDAGELKDYASGSLAEQVGEFFRGFKRRGSDR